jgi:hypothetical protein
LGVPVPGRAWFQAVQPDAAATLMGAPGEMSSATAAFGTPSSVSWPMLFELTTLFVPTFTPHAGETAYQSGSASASSSWSSPSVRQGKRPTFTVAPQLMPTWPWRPVVLSKSPGFSGQGRLPGLFSPAFAAWPAT